MKMFEIQRKKLKVLGKNAKMFLYGALREQERRHSDKWKLLKL